MGRIINKQLNAMFNNTESFRKSISHCPNLPMKGGGGPWAFLENYKICIHFSKVLFPLFFMTSSWSFSSILSLKIKWNFFPGHDMSPLYLLRPLLLTSWWLPIINETLLPLAHSLHATPKHGVNLGGFNIVMDVLFWRPPSDIPLLLTSFGEAPSSNTLSPCGYHDYQPLSLLQSYMELLVTWFSGFPTRVSSNLQGGGDRICICLFTTGSPTSITMGGIWCVFNK